jgi:hypothetical protein
MGIALIRRLARSLGGSPFEPPRELLERFPELSSVHWRRGGLPLRVGGAFLGMPTVAAITLWNVVFVATETVISAELLLHELGHVRQFASSWSFPLRYLWEGARRGYAGSRYEREAQAFAVDRLRGGSNLSSRR